MTEPQDAGAVDPDRVGSPIYGRQADNRTSGEPQALRSNASVTVDLSRRLTLRADPPSRRLSTHGQLIGRDRELATLHEALLASAVDGRSIVLGGDAGSGKTALLAAFLTDARSTGIAVVQGACLEIESQRPFGAFADLVASCERAFGSARVEQALKERGVAIRQLTAPGVAAASGSGRDRYQLHGAILGLFADLTNDGPLAIFLEDLHWADPASLELFGYLARRLRGRSVLLVATYRTDDLDRRHPLRLALAELRKARLIEELVIAPLAVEGTGDLIHARLELRDPAPLDLREFRELVHERCEGNPLHTEETLDTLRQSGRLIYAENAWVCDVARIRDAIPANVADGVVARWGALSPAAQHILLVASVAGHRFDLELVAAVSGTPSEALAPLIHEAIDARLVLEETKDQPLSFRHALTREALRQQLLRSERVALHAKVAVFLEQRHAATPVSPAELAYHLEESGDASRASRYHEAAAREAVTLTDYASAARSMERAITTAARDDAAQGKRQLELAGYLRLSGDDPRAARAAAAGLEIGERSGDVRLQARALLELRLGDERNSDEFGGTQLVDRAVTLLEPLGPTPELASAYSFLSAAAARRGDGLAAVALAERVREIATVLGLPSMLALATVRNSMGLYAQGRLEASVAAVREAVQMTRDAGLENELYGALMSLSVFLVATGATSQEQLDLQLQMRAVARAFGLGRQTWIVRELHALHGHGDWDGFLRLLPRVPEPERSDFDVCRLQALFTAVARTGPGETGDVDIAKMRAAYGYSAPSATWAAELLLLAARPREAVALAATITDEEVSRRYWGLIPASQTHSIGLFAARECGDEVARETFIASLLRERPLPVTPNYNRRHIALANADIAESAGRIDEALAGYAVALAECERAQYNDNPVMFVMSLIWQRRAELYLRVTPPDVAAAQAEFDALLAYWQRAKATWYLGQLQAWAEEHGLAFPQTEEAATAAPSLRALTRRELEVARLVAQGLTNREIGDRLTLSVRTAESHVEQIRTKLGFRTRSQIASWVTERYGATRSS